MAEQWMSIVEYARTFKVSDMTVRRRIKTGRLHAVLKEGKYFIPIPVGDARGATSPAPAESARFDAEPRHVESRSVEPRYRAQNDMVVIKGHPAAHRTYATVQPTMPQVEPRVTPQPMKMHEPVAPRADFGLDDDDGVETAVPASLRRSLAGHDSSLVDTRALLAFCEASLRKVNETERRQAEKFKSKLEALEATLAGKDLEIKQLRQQVEDLQLLISVLDVKKGK